NSVWRTTHPSNNTMSVPTGTSARPTTTKASIAQKYFPPPGGYAAPTREKGLDEDGGTESTPSTPYGTRPSSPTSAAIDAFAKFDPFSRRGSKVENVNASGSASAAPSSVVSETVTDTAGGDMWTTPAKKAIENTPTGFDVVNSAASPEPDNDIAWTSVPSKNKGVKSAAQQTVAPSVALSSTWATTAASVTAPTVFEENVASGRYGRPGRITPRREGGGASGGWFKSTKPPKGDTTDYGFETYAPADLAEHAPLTKRPNNSDGWESEDEM
ncbi:hypothetical protein V491_00923, partial [Pseudogymnoascus sp. VKM F-3775]